MKFNFDKFIFSTRLMSFLFIAFALSMAVATFLENSYGTPAAKIWVYNTWWFEGIMFLLTLNFIGNIKRYQLHKKEHWPTLLLHLSWILIILGAFITRYISFEGMMTIREGETSNSFLSEKTYLTYWVDGTRSNGEEARRKFHPKELLLSPHANNSFNIKNDFDGQAFTISYKNLIADAVEGVVESPEGTEYLQLVEAGDGTRHNHFIENGQVVSIHNMLFALNNDTPGAINLFINDSIAQLKTPFEGSVLQMITQQNDSVYADSLQQLKFRSLYDVGGMQFVVPEALVTGQLGVIPSPNKSPNPEEGLFLTISANGEEKEVALLGGQGYANPLEEITVGGLKFHLAYGSIPHELPFSLTLEDFIAERYPGTESGYSSFKSKVLINEENQSIPYDIYMNHVLDKEGYRFFQAGFDPDELGTHLSVNHDFWGTNITYLGYLLLYLGLMLILFWKNSRFGKISKRLQKIVQKKAQLAGCIIFACVGFSATAQNPDDPLHMNAHLTDSILEANKVDAEHAAKFGRLVVQDNGRMKPVNTFASEFLRKLSKSDQYGSLNAEQAMLSIMEFPLLWYSADIIYIKKGNDSIRKLIGAPTDAKRVKPVLFFDEKGNYKLAPYLQEAYAADVPNQFQKDFKDIDQRLGLLMSVINGNNFRIFPKLGDENNRWYSYAELDEAKLNPADSTFAKRVLPVYVSKLKEAKTDGDYSEADRVITNLAAFQQNNGSDVIPDVRSIELEILYNKYDIFKSLHYYYLLFGLLMFVVILWHMLKPVRWLEFLITGFQALIILAFIVQTLGLIARWYISGHAPWSDAYESMIYVSWATMGVALMFASRSKLTVAAAAFVVSMILMVAHWNWMDPSIANLQPVLDSYWLMIHVAVIVGSYGPFAIGMILGVVSLILMIFTTKNNYKRFKLNLEELSIINEMALTVGLVMLTIGNFLGGMWANESWGRYWGWDPKETWALISIFVYAFVIHMRLVPGLKGFWKFNLASILAFGSILMTYFGVNFYLSGLHSYASGDQIISYKFIVYSLIAIGILGYLSNRKYRKFYKK